MVAHLAGLEQLLVTFPRDHRRRLHRHHRRTATATSTCSTTATPARAPRATCRPSEWRQGNDLDRRPDLPGPVQQRAAVRHARLRSTRPGLPANTNPARARVGSYDPLTGLRDRRGRRERPAGALRRPGQPVGPGRGLVEVAAWWVRFHSARCRLATGSSTSSRSCSPARAWSAACSSSRRATTGPTPGPSRSGTATCSPRPARRPRRSSTSTTARPRRASTRWPRARPVSSRSSTRSPPTA